MLKVGEFAQLGQVTVRTLRYYDEIGLLTPDYVDPWTGYRYYARSQLSRLKLILTLKNLGCSLEQVRSMLDENLGSDDIRELLKRKEVELETQVRDVSQQLVQVRTWLEQIERVPLVAGEGAGKEIVTMMAGEYPRVVLAGAVEAFEQVEREINHWQPRSWVQVQLICMRSAGWKDIDYETLMTISGFGPSFAYHPKELWWAQYLTPSGCDERIARATGFGFEWKQYVTAEAYWQALKETIAAGEPIHAAYLEEVLLVGYQEANDRAARQVKPLAPLGVAPETWWTWEAFETWFTRESHGFLGRHTGKVAQASRIEAAITTLETIVELACKDPRAENPDFVGVRWGLDGLEAYAADVGDISRSGQPDEYFHEGWLGCHAIYPQVSGRACAAVFLQRLGKSETFQKEISMQILAAAGEYQAARAAWGEYERQLGNEETAAASNNWLIGEHRRAGAAAIRRAIAHETAAVAEIEKVLTALS